MLSSREDSLPLPSLTGSSALPSSDNSHPDEDTLFGRVASGQPLSVNPHSADPALLQNVHFYQQHQQHQALFYPPTSSVTDSTTATSTGSTTPAMPENQMYYAAAAAAAAAVGNLASNGTSNSSLMLFDGANPGPVADAAAHQARLLAATPTPLELSSMQHQQHEQHFYHQFLQQQQMQQQQLLMHHQVHEAYYHHHHHGHLMTPMGLDGTTPLHSGKRQQVRNACVNCQKACKKCDDMRPCNRCIKYGIEGSCVDSTRKARARGIKRGPYKRRSNKDSDEPYTPGNENTPGSVQSGDAFAEATRAAEWAAASLEGAHIQTPATAAAKRRGGRRSTAAGSKRGHFSGDDEDEEIISKKPRSHGTRRTRAAVAAAAETAYEDESYSHHMDIPPLAGDALQQAIAAGLVPPSVAQQQMQVVAPTPLYRFVPGHNADESRENTLPVTANPVSASAPVHEPTEDLFCGAFSTTSSWMAYAATGNTPQPQVNAHNETVEEKAPAAPSTVASTTTNTAANDEPSRAAAVFAGYLPDQAARTNTPLDITAAVGENKNDDANEDSALPSAGPLAYIPSLFGPSRGSSPSSTYNAGNAGNTAPASPNAAPVRQSTPVSTENAETTASVTTPKAISTTTTPPTGNAATASASTASTPMKLSVLSHLCSVALTHIDEVPPASAATTPVSTRRAASANRSRASSPEKEDTAVAVANDSAAHSS